MEAHACRALIAGLTLLGIGLLIADAVISRRAAAAIKVPKMNVARAVRHMQRRAVNPDHEAGVTHDELAAVVRQARKAVDPGRRFWLGVLSYVAGGAVALVCVAAG